MSEFRITGVRELQRNLDRVARNAPRVAGNALEIEADLIMTDSKENYAPVGRPRSAGGRGGSAGTLRASGHVNPVEIKGGNISVTMGYGGAAAPYAEAIHEHPSGASPPSWRGKTLNFYSGGDRRKYLEKPLMAARSGLGLRLARRIRVEDMR